MPSRRSLWLPLLVTSVVSSASWGDALTVELQAVGSSLSSGLDYDGDCYHTGADVAAAVRIALASSPQGLHHDTDGDGFVTAADTILRIEGLILASVNDPDGSGVIDVGDIATVLDAAASTGTPASATSGEDTPQATDVNMDGVTDTQDVVEIAEATANPVPAHGLTSEDLERLAVEIHSQMQSIQLDVDTGVITEDTVLPAPCGTLAGNWPEPKQADHYFWVSWFDPLNPWDRREHIEQVSVDYPAEHWEIVSLFEPNPHHSLFSRALPPNHIYDVSLEQPYPTWEEDWPANHERQFSNSWEDERPVPGTGGHFADTSLHHNVQISLVDPTGWPSWHNTSESNEKKEGWWRHPNHLRHISGGWPDGHTNSISSGWPANHEALYSQQNQPDPNGHNTIISATWYDEPTWDENGNPIGDEHSQLGSSKWPPSHADKASDTWGPIHGLELSISWPGSHSRQVSISWPERLQPGHWPPNHHADPSRSWDDNETPPTFPDPGTWPIEHELETSLRWLPLPAPGRFRPIIFPR